MKTYPSIVFATEDDIQLDFSALIEDYEDCNGTGMSVPEAKYFVERMQLSVKQRMAYRMKDSFMYICYEPKDIRILSLGLNDTPINDAYFLASLLKKHKPYSFMPLGRDIRKLLPFLNRVSHKKWFHNHTPSIKLLGYEQLDDLLEYLDV